MLIQALCDYYDVLDAEGKLPPKEYRIQDIHYCISLTEDGKIDAITPFGDVDAKGNVTPRATIMPYQKTVTGTSAKLIDYRSKYIFGLLPKNAKSAGLVLSENDEHKDFAEKNLRFIEGLHSPIIDAFRAFLQNWNPEAETQNKLLLDLKKLLDKKSFVFCLRGRPDLLLHEDKQIQAAWEAQFLKSSLQTDGKIFAQCAITGEVVPIAQLHDAIKITGAKNGAAPLISCNFAAGESYNNTQAYNSNISEVAMQKYTVTLNTLLRDPHHYQDLNGMTVVYWAYGGTEVQNSADLMSALTFGDIWDAKSIDAALEKLLQCANKGTVLPEQLDAFGNINTNVTFYIAGLMPAPGGGRISLKFLYCMKFGKILRNIAQYQNDLQIGDTVHAVPLYQIKEALFPTSDKKAPTTIQGKIKAIDASFFNSIINSVIRSSHLPNFMMTETIRRVKAERNITALQAGILKAYINQKSRIIHQKEELTLALDTNNTTPAYLCGRLFAVLERLQKETVNVSRTIRDTSFASAASKPAFVFPELLKSAQIYLSKLSGKSPAFSGYYNKCIREIMNELNGEFPESLSQPEQAKFMVGYYHQMNYQKPKTENTENTEESNNGAQ